MNQVRQLSGEIQIAIGIVHTLVGLRTQRKLLAAIRDEGLLNAVKDDAERRGAFWFLFGGILLAVDGQLLRWIQQRTGIIPPFHGWSLLVVSVIGVVLMPKSGFWFVLAHALMQIGASRHSTQWLKERTS